MADRQTDKTEVRRPIADSEVDLKARGTKWAFTAYQAQWPHFEKIPPIVAEWGFQEEICPETGRHHYQGYLRTKQQQRHSALREVLPGVNITPARNWNALLNYCRKSETAVPGTQQHQVNQTPNIYSLAAQIAEALPDLDSMKDEFEALRQRIRKNTIRGEQPNYATYNADSWPEYFWNQVKTLVTLRIMEGEVELAWTAINPMWIAMWKNYGEAFVKGVKKNVGNSISLNGSSLSPPPSPSCPSSETCAPSGPPLSDDE